ncbi:NAD(P)-dependent oxidoreductase [Paraburkholderia sp. Tr-20389]|uniref:NAD-dependent epimerase/dehydratase family protein n=1 Tax=Paraburkholderia sp. Tr-20389 TaxID=2703903 RepID=UPI00197D07DA|nr:NAD-dependent epimerase/dehydratase family protein [Paraburkholderia sp. Tr-20389]MBN3757088.1 NAD(P)-dependent oxidoreductase [Paraburkholderia sp. Tr-20389]
MNRTVFLAGAAGAIGSALVPQLVDAGYLVYGSTRRTDRAAQIERAGATPVIVDVFDAKALKDALLRIQPAAVIHQLTDLPPALDPARMPQAIAGNARIRDEGTRNLLAAALAAGSKRFVAQSIAWAYREGAQPYEETQPLDTDAEGNRLVTVRGVASLETQVLTAPLIGTVLRYGQLYGPGTGSAQAKGASPVHVDAAAHATVLALKHARAGAFNIAEDNPVVSTGKAKRELGWSAAWRRTAAAAAMSTAR